MTINNPSIYRGGERDALGSSFGGRKRREERREERRESEKREKINIYIYILLFTVLREKIICGDSQHEMVPLCRQSPILLFLLIHIFLLFLLWFLLICLLFLP